MKDKLQVIAGAMMIPVILLVVAGVFIGLGAAFVNPENVQALGLASVIYKGGILYAFFKIINDLGFMVMRFLPIFFAVGIAFGLSKKEKGWGALGGLVLFIGMHTVISTLLGISGLNPDTTTVDAFIKAGLSQEKAMNQSSLYTTFLGIFTFDCSIFGAIISGFVASMVHNKYCEKQLCNALSFFAGPRFSQIMMFVVAIPLGVAMYLVWPFLGAGLSAVGMFIGKSGLFGTFIFGALDKTLLPFGIHHLIAFPIEYTSVGGVMKIGGHVYEGVNNIKMAQMGDPNSLGYITRNFTTGRLLIHFAILPAAALAMYRTAKPENKKKAASILVPAIITAMLVGITEPIEYTFLFVAPMVYFLIYVPLSGLTYVLTEAFNVSIMGEAFRNMFPNLLQPQKVHAWPLVFLIPIFFVVVYFIFKFVIEKFDLKTPGRGDIKEVKLYSKKEYRDKENKNHSNDKKAGNKDKNDGELGLILGIVDALGGVDNIENLTNCATRLRVELKDVEKSAVDDIWVNELDASGVVRRKKSLQIIYGPRVITLVSKIKSHFNMD
ncbi:PTS glucose transporter subunit IIBC [Clostridium niameyense]|uniref:PTS glucose transporter subunit IIBC n=1 Tax=Clostridium niameyense TaxID=1622073 RepID=A0A6M0RAR2_9CLOT|nr:PTS transporter subunit EIIC [Clostridium niameyense]NEZ46750.1 PTS glucose transporter subunit IIBC [Clostridium niameyense]